MNYKINNSYVEKEDFIDTLLHELEDTREEVMIEVNGHRFQVVSSTEGYE